MAIPKGSDVYVVRIARKMERLTLQLSEIINEISNSKHPNAEVMAEDLYAQCWVAAWPTHVISSYLEHPERWETDGYGIHVKRKESE